MRTTIDEYTTDEPPLTSTPESAVWNTGKQVSEQNIWIQNYCMAAWSAMRINISKVRYMTELHNRHIDVKQMPAWHTLHCTEGVYHARVGVIQRSLPVQGRNDSEKSFMFKQLASVVNIVAILCMLSTVNKLFPYMYRTWNPDRMLM